MYEKHFGLRKKLFSSKAEDRSVFVGPHQAKVIKSVGAGLISVDSIVAVSGPVGVGKTTIVSRALESITPGRMVAWVGRMTLAPDEVLQLLLTGFGISRQASGTVQKFAAFRRLLSERANAGAQLAIVVEDAMRVGLDALLEMEALTAADSGDATGANIILMGQPELNEWLTNPALARLRQRTRLRIRIEPFNAAEVQGYLRHSIRESGGDVDSVLDAGAIDMLYRCSEGIPRVINNLCESALAMAAVEGIRPLTAQFIHEIARDALGIDVVLPAAAVMRTDSPTAKPSPQPERRAVKIAPDIESTQPQKRPDWMLNQTRDDDGEEGLPGEISFEVEQTSRMQAINADKIARAEKEGKEASTFKMAPMIRVDKKTKIRLEAAAAGHNDAEDDDIPMLSQSMRIDSPKPATAEQMAAERRKVEAQAKARAEAKAKAKAQAEARSKAKVDAEAKAKAKAKAEAEARARAEAKAKAEARAKAEAKAKAEARARAEAKAKAEARARAEAKAKAAARTRAQAKATKAADSPRMPDIDALEAALAAARAKDDHPVAKAAADKDDSGTGKRLDGVPALTLDAALEEKRSKARPISAATAAGLGKAASLQDLTDTMAETLFGNAEFEAIAAEVVAKPLSGKASAGKSASADAPAAKPGLDKDRLAAAAEQDPSLVLELVEDTLAAKHTQAKGSDNDMQMSTTRRLDLVKQLNSNRGMENAETHAASSAKPAPRNKPGDPASLEEQLQSAMTATLKVLESGKAPAPDSGDDEPKKKTGLFGRFSRS